MPSSGLIASVLFDGTDQYLYMVSIPSSGLIASQNVAAVEKTDDVSIPSSGLIASLKEE